MKNYSSIKLSLLGVGCFLVLALASCDKAVVKKPGTPVFTEKIKTMNCSPWRNVTGFVALSNELNQFANCATMDCSSGNSLTSTTTQYVFTSLYSSTQIITPTEQNNVISAANTWANAHKPAPDYFVAHITYTPDYVVGPTYGALDITVTYKKCLPPNDPQD